jgi:hypothetical protein
MSWTIVEVDPTTRRIGASAQSFWMGFALCRLERLAVHHASVEN